MTIEESLENAEEALIVMLARHAALMAALEQLAGKWRNISSRPLRPTGFLLCADELGDLLRQHREG